MQGPKTVEDRKTRSRHRKEEQDIIHKEHDGGSNQRKGSKDTRPTRKQDQPDTNEPEKETDDHSEGLEPNSEPKMDGRPTREHDKNKTNEPEKEKEDHSEDPETQSEPNRKRARTEPIPSDDEEGREDIESGQGEPKSKKRGDISNNSVSSSDEVRETGHHTGTRSKAASTQTPPLLATNLPTRHRTTVGHGATATFSPFQITNHGGNQLIFIGENVARDIARLALQPVRQQAAAIAQAGVHMGGENDAPEGEEHQEQPGGLEEQQGGQAGDGPESGQRADDRDST